jgi:hypothetical protein
MVLIVWRRWGHRGGADYVDGLMKSVTGKGVWEAAP